MEEKSLNITKVTILLTGMALPILYLNCEGGAFHSKPYVSLSSLQCIQKSNKMITPSQKVQLFQPHLPGSKLLLENDLFVGPTLNKLDKEGIPITVMIESQCALNAVQQKSGEISLSQSIAEKQRIDGSLKYQTFRWSIHSQSELDKFEEEINKDPCIYAAGLEQLYKMSRSSKVSLNDPEYSQQLHLENLQFEVAHPIFYHPDKGLQKLRETNEDIVVAVIDSGVAYTHGDLISNMWQNAQGRVGINATSIGVIGGEEDFDPFEVAPNSHGTHVAGIIAAQGNNQKGGTGLAPFGVKIMAVRVFNAANGNTITSSTTDLVAGIYWAADNGADVINISLAKYANGDNQENVRDQILEIAIKYALDKDIFIVFAAGNGNDKFSSQEITEDKFTSLPARYGSEFSGAMTVGSYDVDTFKRSSFSHFSSHFVEIGAPGQQTDSQGTAFGGIFSTVSPVYVNNVLEDQYGRLHGTSMAAPMVTAAAALAKGLIKQNKGLSIPPEELERLIKISAKKNGHLTNEFESGNSLDLSRLAAQVVVDYDLEIPLGNLSQLICP